MYFVKKHVPTHLDGETGFLAPLRAPNLVFGLFRSVQGASWKRLGQCWERLGRVIEGLGLLLGGSKLHLGAILGLLISILATQW